MVFNDHPDKLKTEWSDHHEARKAETTVTTFELGTFTFTKVGTEPNPR